MPCTRPVLRRPGLPPLALAAPARSDGPAPSRVVSAWAATGDALWFGLAGHAVEGQDERGGLLRVQPATGALQLRHRRAARRGDGVGARGARRRALARHRASGRVRHLRPLRAAAPRSGHGARARLHRRQLAAARRPRARARRRRGPALDRDDGRARVARPRRAVDRGLLSSRPRRRRRRAHARGDAPGPGRGAAARGRVPAGAAARRHARGGLRGRRGLAARRRGARRCSASRAPRCTTRRP